MFITEQLPTSLHVFKDRLTARVGNLRSVTTTMRFGGLQFYSGFDGMILVLPLIPTTPPHPMIQEQTLLWGHLTSAREGGIVLQVRGYNEVLYAFSRWVWVSFPNALRLRGAITIYWLSCA